MNNLDFIMAKNGLGKLACITATSNRNIDDFIQQNNSEINCILLKYGGLLLRGFNIHAISEFNRLATAICPILFDYLNRSTPRTRLGGKIYTATEYHQDRHILFHNENSYTSVWPDKILFFCVIPAQEGGETPVADSRQVYNLLPQEIINEFTTKKILYTRNFIPGIDLSWQEVFQTKNKRDVEQYCDENKIEYIWQEDNLHGIELVTKQICQSTLKHPQTGEYVWFNQAHLFDISALESNQQEVLIKSLGNKALPRNSCFGDGSMINPEYLNLIRHAYEREKIEFKWHKSDVMILDNRLMAHARNPFKGERKIAVAMGR